jgi:hypothetical protein
MVSSYIVLSHVEQFYTQRVLCVTIMWINGMWMENKKKTNKLLSLFIKDSYREIDWKFFNLMG